ncbi:hypothetical protein [Endozoicomonas atrinae]|uniref:hypothetical protein n=1 Tax=Endozoicomonas atrinae TaxID=1333660 RepID=UPI000825B8A0|nr:hypothetical protein [Endozoicomonas atrinae]
MNKSSAESAVHSNPGLALNVPSAADKKDSQDITVKYLPDTTSHPTDPTSKNIGSLTIHAVDVGSGEQLKGLRAESDNEPGLSTETKTTRIPCTNYATHSAAEEWIKSLSKLNIPEDRLAMLDTIVECVLDTISKHRHANLLYVCKENTRRSQYAQALSAFLAMQYDLPVSNFSSGQSPKQVFGTVLRSLKGAGLTVTEVKQGINAEGTERALRNPTYEVKHENKLITNLWSKTTSNLEAMPGGEFIAIMVCGCNENNAPIIQGRMPSRTFDLKFDDPKMDGGDDLPDKQHLEKYNKTRDVIGAQLDYIMRQTQLRCNQQKQEPRDTLTIDQKQPM